MIMDLDFWRRHPGRAVGLGVGLLFGLLTVAVGFWQTLFILLCAGLGYLAAWYLEQYGGLYGFLNHIWRRR